MNIPHTKTPKFNTTNSVPLRYETVITEQPKERRGFGKTSPRFHPRKLDEVPGPGYVDPHMPSATTNSKGYGNGFVSKTRRFDNELPLPKPYGAETYFVPNGNDATSVRSAFAPPVKDQVSRKLPENDTAGPGTYNPNQPTLHNSGAKSCFNSNTKRFFDSMTDNMNVSPGPGKYSPEDVEPHKTTVPIFKSKLTRHLWTPREDFPGPGKYEQDEDQKKKTPKIEKLRYTIKKYDVEPTVPIVTPGPGAYDNSPLEHKQKRTQAPFLSTSERKYNMTKDVAATPNFTAGSPV